MPPACTRCKSAPSSTHHPTPLCLPCFRAYVRRTFRTSLGRLSAGGPPSGIAVAISGGASSAALAHLHAAYLATLNRAPSAAPPPPLLFLHALPPTATPHPAVPALATHVPRATLRLVRLPAHLAASLRAVSDPTDRAALASAAVLAALRTAAADAHCHTLLLGTAAHRAAADVLLTLATRRGAHIRLCAKPQAPCATPGVRLVRPLRDVAARVVWRYVRDAMPAVAWDPRAGASVLGVYASGIVDVVERFVEAAGEGNAASVHNVVKTADRLKEPAEEKWCRGCGGVAGAEFCAGCEEIGRRAGGMAVVRTVAERRVVGLEEMRKGVEEFLL